VDTWLEEPGLAEGVAGSEHDNGARRIARVDPNLDLTSGDEPEQEPLVARREQHLAKIEAPDLGTVGKPLQDRLVEPSEDFAAS
jgi:hypothetical protein